MDDRPLSRRAFLTQTAGLAAAGLAMPPGLASPAAQVDGLPRRPFGKTGVDVTLVGLGGGSRFYEPVGDDETGAELVRQAIDRGIGVIETSANYGSRGQSEVRIGLAMKTRRGRVFLETKIDARDYDGAMREMERSLARLQTDRLDLVLHHFLQRAEELADVAGPNGAERAIRKLVDEKVVRFRGFSCHVPALTLDGIRRLEPQALQLPLNAVRIPDFERAVLPLASERGIAVVAMKTCGHGYFARAHTTRPDRIDRFGPPAAAYDAPDLPTYREFLHYALSLPIATAVVGVDSRPTIDGIAANAAAFRPLARAAMDDIARRAQVFATTGYWI